MFLLDTNVVSELRKAKSGKADEKVLRWFSAVDVSKTFISSITLMELEMGVLAVERKDKKQGKLLRDWLENQVIPTFEQRIVPIDANVARRCARLHVPDRRSERDALIAASALVHGMTVITRNTADFQSTKVPLFNPWAAGSLAGDAGF